MLDWYEPLGWHVTSIADLQQVSSVISLLRQQRLRALVRLHLVFSRISLLLWRKVPTSNIAPKSLELTHQSPGMGLNAYFTYQVVGFHGTGSVSYGLALTAVFIEGWIFVFLSLIGMRQWLVRVIPSSVKVASGVGIGIFLTEIGMSYSGIGLISGSNVTPTDLAGCPPQYIDANSGRCTSHKMQNPTVGSSVQAHHTTD